MESPIILFGTGRTGTTIFMEALFKHRDIAYFSNYLERSPEHLYLNFVRYIFDNKVYRVFGSKEQHDGYQLFNRLIFKPSEAYSIWDYLTNDEINFSRDFLINKSASEKTRNEIHAYISKITKYQGKNRFGVKITGPGRIHYLHSLFPDSQYIWLKREFIPTLSSFLKVDFWQGRKNTEPWWIGAYDEEDLVKMERIKDNPVLFTAYQLKKIVESNHKQLAIQPVHLREISYEEFVERPTELLSEVLTWLNLTEDSSCFKFLDKNRIRNRNKTNLEYFSEKQLAEIEEVVGTDFLKQN